MKLIDHISGPRFWLCSSVLLVWSFGIHYSVVGVRAQSEPRPEKRWFDRYAKLSAHLGAEPKVAIVYDPEAPRAGHKRLFRAQYVLAPTIIEYEMTPRIRPRRVPLLFDYADPRALQRTLRDLEANAEVQALTLRVTRVARGLALVWIEESSTP